MNGLLQISRRTALAWLSATLAAQDRRTKSAHEPNYRWVVYYGNREPFAAFDAYTHVVFDSRFHPPLPTRRSSIVVGYLSLGEASPDYAYFDALKSAGLLVHPSSTWRGNLYIDLRSPEWQRRVCDELVPWILSQGFDGVFLDTLDSALQLETIDPVRYAGMQAAALELITRIRTRYPDIVILMNRAYPLLQLCGGLIDAVIGESVLNTFNFDTQLYERVNPTWYREQVERLSAARRDHPQLLLFTLDYANPDQPEVVREIYRQERNNGFHPYVSTIDLSALYPEP